MNEAIKDSVTDALRAMATSNSDLYEYERLQLKDAADTIDTLRAQLAEAQRDAERYRYLRTLDASRDPPTDKTMWVVQYRHPPGAIPELVSGGFGESLDAAIDAVKGESNEPT